MFYKTKIRKNKKKNTRKNKTINNKNIYKGGATIKTEQDFAVLHSIIETDNNDAKDSRYGAWSVKDVKEAYDHIIEEIINNNKVDLPGLINLIIVKIFDNPRMYHYNKIYNLCDYFIFKMEQELIKNGLTDGKQYKLPKNMRKNIKLIFKKILIDSSPPSPPGMQDFPTAVIYFKKYIKNVLNSSEEYERKQSLAATIISTNESDLVPKDIQELIVKQMRK